MALVAQTDRAAPLNISVVWSDGSRVFEWVHRAWSPLKLTSHPSVAQTDIVCGSGTYSYGLANAVGDLLGMARVWFNKLVVDRPHSGKLYRHPVNV